MQLFYLPLLLALSARAQTPPAGRPLASFIPTHYHVLDEGRATGDLNHDGQPDVALVVASAAEDAVAHPPDNLPPRRLLVLLAAPGGGYRLAAQSRTAVLCKGCGGVMGDPFASLRIEQGVLSLGHYGGSSWRWSVESKFRRQPDGKFYLIGETNETSRPIDGPCPGLNGTPGEDYRDENFVTGAYEVRRISENCKLLENRRGRRPVRPLRSLAGYNPAP